MRTTFLIEPRIRGALASGWTLRLFLFTRRGSVSDSYR